VLQEGELERVGGSRTIKVDVRLIAATHRDLEAAVEAGEFREDLYYRLNVMPILPPPLRERMEDLPEIAGHLLERLGGIQGRKLSLTAAGQRRLAQHNWPGNVRELENCLERASVMSLNGEIDADLIRIDKPRAGSAHNRPIAVSSAPTLRATSDGDAEASELEPGSEQSERQRVVAALEQAGWVQARAARLLGMTPRQIAYRIQTLNIEVRQI
jgi:Nif-specific regulatory protein